MVTGWGSGFQEFVGYGASINCPNCHNQTTEQIYVTYSYEMVMLIKWRHMGDRGSWVDDGYIQFLCPICLHGYQIMGLEAVTAEKKKIAKQDGGPSAAAFAIEAQNKINALNNRFDMEKSRSWFKSLSYLRKRDVVKALNRVGLNRVATLLES